MLFTGEGLLIGIPSRRQALSLPNLTNETLPSMHSQAPGIQKYPPYWHFLLETTLLTFLKILYSEAS